MTKIKTGYDSLIFFKTGKIQEEKRPFFLPIPPRLVGRAAGAFSTHFFCFCLTIISLLLVACDFIPTNADSGASLADTLPTPVDTPDMQLTLEPVETPNATENPEINLVVWVLPEIELDSESAGATVFQTQLDQFAEGRPNLNLRTEMKTPIGQGGMVSYVQSGRSVAPGILPDVMLIPSYLVEEFINLEAAFPLEELVSEEAADDFFPAALEIGKVDSTWYAYPYIGTGLDQIIYNTEQITTAVPVSWDGIIENELDVILPAASRVGAQFLLQLYTAFDGQFINEEGELILQREPLTAALELIQEGREAGSILDISADITSEMEGMERFEDGVGDILITSINRLDDAPLGSDRFGYSPLPGPAQSLPAAIEGWVWVISSADPTKQALAGDLILWMADTENVGSWSLQSGHLPLRRSAFESWPDSPYNTFLQAELARAEQLSPTVRGQLDSFATALRVLFSSDDPDINNIVDQAIVQLGQ